MASNTPKKNRPSQLAAEQKLADGVNKHESTLTSFVIAGSTMTTKDLLATLRKLTDSAHTVQETKATWQNAVKADIEERVKLKTFLSGLRQALLVAFAGSIDTLADFGLTPRKVVVRTPEQKTAVAEKAKATRAARHTMGPKKKAAIKGVPAPATPTASPPPAPAPAPSPSPGTTHQP